MDSNTIFNQTGLDDLLFGAVGGTEPAGEQISVLPGPNDQFIGTSANHVAGFSTQLLPDAVKSTARAIGSETEAVSYKAFLLSLVDECPLKRQLVDFVDAEVPAVEQSLVPIDAFVGNPDRSSWDIHCPVVNKLWDEFCSTVRQLSNGQIEVPEMTAPSGPSKAKATFLWHYPTFSSPNTHFGHVMDPQSASLKVQKFKIGLPRDVRTQNIIPIRVDYDKQNGPEWDDTFDNWPAIMQACLELNIELTKNDRFLVLFGEALLPDLKAMTQQRGWSLKPLELSVTIKMFGKAPRFYLAVDAQGTVRQVIFHLYHGQFVYHNSEESAGALWDLLWNAVFEFATIPVINNGYLAWAACNPWRGKSIDLARDRERIGSHSIFQKLIATQKEQHREVSILEIQTNLPELLAKEPGLVADMEQAVAKGYTPLSAIQQHFIGKTMATRSQNRATKRAADPADCPSPKKTKRVDESKVVGAMKSAEVRQGTQAKKWEALRNTYQVRQAVAARGTPQCTVEQKRLLERLDRLETNFKTDPKKFSSDLSGLVVWYDEKKYPRGLKFLPEHGPDPFADRDHPAVALSWADRIKGVAMRAEIAGPVQDGT
ncbi:hypothetical protein O9K51_00244 [Purpureocillium lavendulum]|uniref:Uncharacterized protein n=1 Tax=Purpureocillium lavendulum TaxID=1247861 RepID=A0AB34G1E5_9HYPO|nr:hypothetical protein O9K51_00244 [Purpureocillium lavendulum]